MAEERKGAPPRDTIQRIHDIARHEGVTLPPLVAEELRTKIQHLRLAPGDAMKIVREVVRRFRQLNADQVVITNLVTRLGGPAIHGNRLGVNGFLDDRPAVIGEK